MTEEIKGEVKEIEGELLETEPMKLARAQFGSFMRTVSGDNWSPDGVDKLEVLNLKKYKEIVEQCRFFYRRDPIASTVLNKLIEIGITNLIFDKGSLSDNEFRIYLGVRDKLQDFAEECALEYLITGMVIPEVEYEAVNKEDLMDMKIKKHTALSLPTSMWVRDSGTIKINTPFVELDNPSFFVTVPEELVIFIQNKGMYPDGTEDYDLYRRILKHFPEFVNLVNKGETEILLENDYILRRKVQPDSPYPAPYLYPTLESLKHKRNMRRMDYSIAARVISAIMLIRLGNDEFPILEDEEDAFDDLKEQMFWRNSGQKDLERIFQLFANHTVEIEWIFPPADILLDESKYAEVNQDIFFSLGFPRVLTTGESQKTGTSDPEFSSLSPVKTMENLQRKILFILQGVVKEIAKLNKLKNYPEIRFSNINLHTFNDFVQGMSSLYESGSLSRSSYVEAFGYNLVEELKKLKVEMALYKQYGLPEMAHMPFSPQPQSQTSPAKTTQKPQNKPKEK